MNCETLFYRTLCTVLGVGDSIFNWVQKILRNPYPSDFTPRLDSVSDPVPYLILFFNNVEFFQYKQLPEMYLIAL